VNQTFSNFFRPMVLIGLCSLCLSSASAASITIVNPSFEDPSLDPGGFGQPPTGWDFSGQGGVWNPPPASGYFNVIPDQNQILYLGFGGSDGVVSQDLGVSLQANTAYTLSFYVGQRNDMEISPYVVSLLAGTTLLASDSAGSPGPGDFVLRTFTFDSGATPAAGNLNIMIDVPSSAPSGGQAAFDLFTLTTNSTSTSAAPEPGTLALLGSSLAALTALTRRRSSQR
jgi:hypothetical protein